MQRADSKPLVPWARACRTQALIPLPKAMDVEKKMAVGMFQSRTLASGMDNGKEVNPWASGVQISKARHERAAPWARRFLPGSKESGSALPAS